MLNFLALASLAGVALAAPTAVRQEEPCAAVAAVASLSTAPGFNVDPDLALACLRSVPFDTKNSTDILKTFISLTEQQSHLAYNKNPPPGVLYGAVDILGGLRDILSKAQSGYYKNEFDFHYDIFSITSSSRDYHYNYNIDILGFFSWKRPTALVSLSPNGVQLPEIYLVTELQYINSSIYEPSYITKIDDVDTETWLNKYAGDTPYDHDLDANYNYVLYNAPSESNGLGKGLGTFASSQRPVKPETKLTFANGTEYTMTNFARSTENFTDITNGQTFFDKFCHGAVVLPETPNNEEGHATVSSVVPTATYNAFTAVSTQTEVTPVLPTYPKALVAVKGNTFAGYLPDDLPDTAVLQLPTFDITAETTVDFQNAVRGLLATASQQGKKKLIIDVRGNGGGSVGLGYDTFRQIFPETATYGGSNLRSTPFFQNATEVLFNYAKSTPLDNRTELYNNASTYHTTGILDKDGKAFNTAASIYGPARYYDDSFSEIERWNITDENSTGITIYGDAKNKLPIKQVFKPEDVLLLTDGFCGSTCSVFAELLKAQALVKSVAVGGRKQYGPMQAVGGTKGSEVASLSVVGKALAGALSVANQTYSESVLRSSGDIGGEGLANLLLRTNNGEGVRVNYRNAIRQSDETRTPLQHVYEAADCRFFYTANMLKKQSLVWKMAYDIKWKGANCISGSADQPSSLSGALLSYVNNYPPVGANYTFNAKPEPFPSGISNAASKAGATGAPSAAPSGGASVMATATTYVGSNPQPVPTASPSAKSTGHRETVGSVAFLVLLAAYLII